MNDYPFNRSRLILISFEKLPGDGIIHNKQIFTLFLVGFERHIK
jgi:hypothetical protein